MRNGHVLGVLVLLAVIACSSCHSAWPIRNHEKGWVSFEDVTTFPKCMYDSEVFATFGPPSVPSEILPGAYDGKRGGVFLFSYLPTNEAGLACGCLEEDASKGYSVSAVIYVPSAGGFAEAYHVYPRQVAGRRFLRILSAIDPNVPECPKEK
jgi:hypothetical protein